MYALSPARRWLLFGLKGFSDFCAGLEGMSFSFTFLLLFLLRQLTDCSFLYQTHSTYMTGKELTDNLRQAISLREAAFTEGEYLYLDVEVRRIQRCIDRMRLEIYVRVGDKQLMLADVLDLRDSCVRLNMSGDVNYLNDLIEQAMKIEFEP